MLPSTMMFDLGIEDGTVVFPSGRRRTSIYVNDGRIAALQGEHLPTRRRVDATDLLVMPGFLDAHVHFMDPSATDREDFPTGSTAAARAGVTTVIEHSHSGPVRTAEDLMDKARYLADRSVVDFALAAHAWPGSDAVEGVWKAGAAFIKAFTCTTHGIPGHDDPHLRALFTQTAATGAVTLVHSEDEDIVSAAENKLRDDGVFDGSVIPRWRTREAELVAAERVSRLAQLFGATVIIAHASNTDVVEACGRQRAAGGRVFVESCPQYLTLMESEVLEFGSFRKFTPPARARNQDDLEAMWRAAARGGIDYLASDHAPSTVRQKRSGSIWDVHFGLPGVDTTSAILLDGASKGWISYERVVEIYSEAPAQIYGMKRKGRLEVGLDADLVLVDPYAHWTVSDGDILSKAGWSPYSGKTLTGRVVATYLRGKSIMDNGRVVSDPGYGNFIPGPGAHN
jgi:dihydroorotase (multifunctional complex type)